MGIRRNLTLAVMLAVGLASIATAAGRRAPDAGPGNVSGRINKNNVKGEYSDYAVRARNVDLSQISNSVTPDTQLQFVLTGLTVPGKYMIELYDNKNSKKVCDEGPYDLTEPAPIKADVFISCGKPPLGYIALGAAGLAAVTTAVIVANNQGTQSASR